MTRLQLASVIIPFFLAGSAIAADMPAKAPIRAPAEAVAYSWTGFYVGAHIGGVWGYEDQHQVRVVALPIPPDPFGGHTTRGFLAGGQVGVNWQTGSWVLGLEAQASWTNADGEHLIAPSNDTIARTELNWLATVALRIGYAWDRTLLYIKGGAAVVNEDFALIPINIAGLRAVTGDQTRLGWMVGAGIERALWSNWSVKLEYNYMDFGRDTYSFIFQGGGPGLNGFLCCDSSFDQHMHVVKAGINYRFGAAAPVVARY